MPIPLLLIWVVGAMAAGAAAGKGAEAIGNGKLDEARQLEAEAQKYVDKRRAEFRLNYKKYLTRLASYSTLIRGMTGDVSSIASAGNQPLPQGLIEFWEVIAAPWGGNLSSKDSGAIFALNRSDTVALQRAVHFSRMTNNSPVAQAAGALLWAFIYSKKGVDYAIEAGSSLERVRARTSEARMNADAEVTKLAAQFAMMEDTWDSKVVPIVSRALGPPRNQSALQMLVQMADLIEETAKARMEEAAELGRKAGEQ